MFCLTTGAAGHLSHKTEIVFHVVSALGLCRLPEVPAMAVKLSMVERQRKQCILGQKIQRKEMFHPLWTQCSVAECADGFSLQAGRLLFITFVYSVAACGEIILP